MKPKNWTEEEKQALALKNTTFNLIDSISRCLPKLNKQQLMEIMLLCNAWSNKIPLNNIKRVPTGSQELGEEVEALTLRLSEAEEKNYALTQRLSEECDRIQNQDGTIRALAGENRKLKHQLFMSTGVRTKVEEICRNQK